jgi:acyl-CoA thioesterase-1
MSTLKLVGIGALVVAIIAGIILLRPHNAKSAIQSATPATAKKSSDGASTISYLPLGDSYTIGQSVSESDRWPNQLIARLATDGKRLNIVANPSVTGYTTQNLIDKELPLVPKLKPDFVTILIGVNDYVQGVDASTFAQHLDYIISTVQKQLPKPGNIVLVTIPDYGKTPTGAQYGSPQESEKGIAAFNAIITAAGAKYNLPVADIFAVSQKVAADPSLIADDGLHPSGKEYTAWTNIIYQTLKTAQLPQ